jgi:tetratricopeptide (TPR) repeat protein
MSLWNALNRAMVLAGTTLLAACYAVSAWGQGAGELLKPTGGRLPESATVSVATLRVPAQAWKHLERARLAAEHHRDEEFERESAKALEIAPKFAEMYRLRAAVELDAHQYEAAISSMQTALRCDPGTLWGSVMLAGAYNGLHRFHDALLVLNAQRGQEADSWQAMYERARAEVGAHDAASALHWSARALDAAPKDFADAHLVRANALILDERLREATGQLEIYLDSKGPQLHRSEVLAMRESLNARMAAAPQAQRQVQMEIASR